MTRMRNDGGQVAAEYLGMMAVILAVIGVLVSTAPAIGSTIAAQICGLIDAECGGAQAEASGADNPIAAEAAPRGAAPAARSRSATTTRPKIPVIYDGVRGYAHISATASPPGANDFSCKPSAAHPRPVILVHGTFADMSNSWQALSPLLHNQGYCVFASNYGSHAGSGLLGVYGTGDVASSAQSLARFVDRVRAATGAEQVDIVGHSQGAMMPRYYLKSLGGAAKVHSLVGLAPSSHGTTADGLATLTKTIPGSSAFLGALCPACRQQLAGSAFMTRLNAGGDTVPGVDYTVIQSRNDKVVTPYDSAFLKGPNVRTSCFRINARWIGESTSRCPTTTSPTPTS